MFIRTKFITNSSSCSFIAWGIPVDWDKIDTQLKIKNLTDDEIEKFWDDMYDGISGITLMRCGYSGKMWAVITDSLVRHLEDEEYIEFYSDSPKQHWYRALGEFCDQSHLERKDPKWFFATVGC